jgi:dolichol-phosphate mannosyltransferase
MNWGYALSYGFLLTLGMLEVVLETKEERKRAMLFILLALAFTLTYVITTPGTKYRAPFDSVMAVMAASALWRLYEAWRAKKNSPPTIGRILSVESLNDRLQSETLIVTPTYNEHANIASFIASISERQVDLLIVDDGSPDGTAEEARRVASTMTTRVWLMRRPKKLGLGTAYTDAFTWVLANQPVYKVILSMDADFSHDPTKVMELATAARDNGFAIGSRYVQGGRCPDWPLRRRLLSRSANFYARTIIGLRDRSFRINDATAGFVAWRRDVLKHVIASDPRSNGYAFLIETKLAAVQAGFSPKEIPITFTDRRHGVSKISKAVIWESAVLPWKLLFKGEKRGK